jgi:hypothetical protein
MESFEDVLGTSKVSNIDGIHSVLNFRAGWNAALTFRSNL